MKVTRFLLLLAAMFSFSKLFGESLKVGDTAPAVSAVTDTGATAKRLYIDNLQITRARNLKPRPSEAK